MFVVRTLCCTLRCLAQLVWVQQLCHWQGGPHALEGWPWAPVRQPHGGVGAERTGSDGSWALLHCAPGAMQKRGRGAT